MVIGMIAIIALIFAVLAFGLLKFVPGAKLISTIAGFVGTLVVLGLFLASVGLPQVANFLAGFPNVVAAGVGFLGGLILAGLIGR